MTDAEREIVVTRYVAGERVFILAADLGVSTDAVTALLVGRGVRRPRGLSETEVAESVALYEGGCSLATIAEQLHRHPETIRLALRRAGVTLRKPWER